MQTLRLVFILTLITMNSLFVHATIGPEVSPPPELANRFCALDFYEGAHSQVLTGFLIKENLILSVGHVTVMSSADSASCFSSKFNFRFVKKLRHPQFDYRHNISGLNHWPKFDFGIFQSRRPILENISPIPLITDHKLAKELLQSELCITGGAGGREDFFKPRIGFVQLTGKIQNDLENHLVLNTGEKALVTSGDSGAPVLCKQNESWVIIGLLEYAGTNKDNLNQKTNVIGIILFRDEILNWLKAESQ